MRWTQIIPLRVRSLFRRGAVDRELEHEMRFHIEQQTAVNIAKGMTAKDARDAAMREFGGVEQYKEECRDMRQTNWIQDFVQDVRFGTRVLLKSPAFAFVAIFTLALGIGANTAIFSVIDAELLRSLPVSDPQTLVLLEWNAKKDPNHLSSSSYGDCSHVPGAGNSNGCSLSEPLFREIQSQTNAFSNLAAFCGGGELNLSGNGTATTVDSVEYVSGNYFETLGIRPESGRLISSADDTLTASPVAVISYGYWKNQFAGSPSVIGKSITLNRVPFTIIGVAEPRFDALSPGRIIQIWMPLSAQRQLDVPWDNRDADPNYWWLVMVGRMKPGVSRSQTQAAVSAIFLNDVIHGAKPQFKAEDNPNISLVPAQAGLTGDTTDMAVTLYVMMLAVGVVLLIACANVAGLLLSRATARQKEMAVRVALGARRGRVVRQLLTESLLLSIAGGALGIFFAQWVIAAIGAFVAANQEGPSPLNPHIDSRVLLFTAGVSILTGFLFGLAPALRGASTDLTPALNEASGGTPSGRPAARWFTIRNTLVVAQVALTVVVLAGAGLLVRTLQSLRNVDPGFDTRNLVTFRIDPISAGYKKAEVDRFYDNLHDRLAAIPGVTSVSYSWVPLLSGGLWTTGFHMEGEPKDKSEEADLFPTGMDFFRTVKIPFRLGREFNSTDFQTAERNQEIEAAQEALIAASKKNGATGLAEQVNKETASMSPLPAIVNEALVRKYFPNKNPIGIRFGSRVADADEPYASPGWLIVGVVADARYDSLRREVNPTIYQPFTGRGATFTLRTAANPSNFVPQIRSVVAQIDANLPVNRIKTESQQIDSQLFAERLIARLSGFFGLLALLLACIGLYGLLAFEVARRTREIGIRMALGARAEDVLRLVVGQGLALALVGAAIGIGTALGVTRFLSSMLFGVKPADPVTFVGVALCLTFVALLACYIPARRAMRVDPMVALRYE
jgi:predicted permease